MADVGSPSITFGATTYGTADCIQVATFTNGAEDLTYRCSGYIKHASGDGTVMLDFSIVIEATDTAKIAALAPGTTGISEYHPFGDTATYIEHTTTNATVMKADHSDSAGKLVTLDITLAWDDCTSGAAAG